MQHAAHLQAVGVAPAGQGSSADEEVLQTPRAAILIPWLNAMLHCSCENVPASISMLHNLFQQAQHVIVSKQYHEQRLGFAWRLNLW